MTVHVTFGVDFYTMLLKITYRKEHKLIYMLRTFFLKSFIYKDFSFLCRES
jgi:hypothetical protein